MNSGDSPRITAPPDQRREPGVGTSAHIFPTSATMIGVCMTVLSFSRLDDYSPAFWAIDKIVAVDALVFLASCLLSFLSIRLGERITNGEARLERRAEYVFMIGIAVLAVSAVLLACVIG